MTATKETIVLNKTAVTWVHLKEQKVLCLNSTPLQGWGKTEKEVPVHAK